jgi:peptidoglycan/xylan/chitin deacetylase (PgdA/CDA1 family)
MDTVRAVLKQTAERLLVTFAANTRRMAGRSLVLAYHNIVRDFESDRGDRSLHLPLSAFRQQLDLLQEHCRVVPLEQIMAGVPDARRPTVAITFDDAYSGAVELGLPELLQRGLPATVFVAPGLLGVTVTWWDALGERAGEGAETERDRILVEEKGRQVAPAGVSLPAHYACATEAQVLESARAGIDLGAHTWSHPNLARLAPEDLKRELEQPLEWLRHHKVRSSMLAYPYGITCPEVEQAAKAAGYAAAFRVEGGWMRRTPDSQWSLPRFNVPAGLSPAGFRLRLAGYFAS